MKKPLALLIFALIRVVSFAAQDSVLRVGIHTDPPFIIERAPGEYEGLCIDLWKDIADELGYQYEMVPYHDLVGMMRALDYQEIDISINPLMVNSLRLKMFEALQPFFISSLGVATTSVSRSQFSMFLSNFFSVDFLKIVLLLLCIIFFFGTLLWLVERRHNRYQFRPGFIGLLDGLWWSAVTMTTVGYGDKAPKTSVGKGIAIVWMFTAVIVISGFTATIASTLTVNSLAVQINQLQDLKAVERISTVGEAGSEDFLVQHNILPAVSYDTPLSALKALARKEVDALVYDKTVMRYLISRYELSSKVQLLPVTFNKQYRTFLLPKGSPLYEAINPVLVSRIHQAAWPKVLKRYELEGEE